MPTVHGTQRNLNVSDLGDYHFHDLVFRLYQSNDDPNYEGVTGRMTLVKTIAVLTSQAHCPSGCSRDAHARRYVVQANDTETRAMEALMAVTVLDLHTLERTCVEVNWQRYKDALNCHGDYYERYLNHIMNMMTSEHRHTTDSWVYLHNKYNRHNLDLHRQATAPNLVLADGTTEHTTGFPGTNYTIQRINIPRTIPTFTSTMTNAMHGAINTVMPTRTPPQGPMPTGNNSTGNTEEPTGSTTTPTQHGTTAWNMTPQVTNSPVNKDEHRNVQYVPVANTLTAAMLRHDKNFNYDAEDYDEHGYLAPLFTDKDFDSDGNLLNVGTAEINHANHGRPFPVTMAYQGPDVDSWSSYEAQMKCYLANRRQTRTSTSSSSGETTTHGANLPDSKLPNTGNK